jgi:NADPH:quinone reductase-like Zn-dependent oxidoreductase
VPHGLALDVAAAAPTAGTTGLSIIDELEPAEAQVILIVGAGGGVGTFATQFALNAGAWVIVNVNATAEDRMRSYGVQETVVRPRQSVTEAVLHAHPRGVDALVDLVSDAAAFASLTSLVRPGGTAISTQYVAEVEMLQSQGIRGVNFRLRQTSELLERVGRALADHMVTVPPLTFVALEEVPGLFESQGRAPDGKTVIVL